MDVEVGDDDAGVGQGMEVKAEVEQERICKARPRTRSMWAKSWDES